MEMIYIYIYIVCSSYRAYFLFDHGVFAFVSVIVRKLLKYFFTICSFVVQHGFWLHLSTIECLFLLLVN